ncbi:MAG: Ig-like domain-containing protein [Methanosarcinaceae archaeon]|nr:Ig-like domain-containing protein [Methanosarcinaceae archaeon]
MSKNAMLGIIILICSLSMISSGCLASDDEKPIHVTAIIEVQVFDENGKPVSGEPVHFKSVKYIGISPYGDSVTELDDWTDPTGKAEFTVGYDLIKDNSRGYAVPESVGTVVSINGATDAVGFGYVEAESQAGGTGVAVISKKVVLVKPGYKMSNYNDPNADSSNKDSSDSDYADSYYNLAP